MIWIIGAAFMAGFFAGGVSIGLIALRLQRAHNLAGSGRPDAADDLKRGAR